MERRSFLISAIALSSGFTMLARPTLSAGAAGVHHFSFGDSLTSGELNFDKPVTKILSDRLGLVSHNFGIGGTSFARGANEIYDALSMYELSRAKISNQWDAQHAAVSTIQPTIAAEYYASVLDAMQSAPIDAPGSLLTFAFGVNDFYANRPIGEDADDTKETFKGAINHVLSQLADSFGPLNIMLSTPVWCVGCEVGNSAGHTLVDYADAVLRIGELRGVPVLDLYRTSGIGADNASAVLGDGLHPNALGYGLLGNSWATALMARL